MSCCLSDAKWKREKIPDHKFDYVDVEEFTDNSFVTQIKYSLVFLFTLKSILTYMAEVGVVVLLFVNLGTGSAFSQTQGDPLNIGFAGRVGLITASVVLSFILLGLDWRKSFLIIQSRDISYAFTSTVAYRYYVIRSYPHFCFFQQINNSKKLKDMLSFWVYFRLKGWKRLLLAEGPRQFFNAVNLYTIIQGAQTKQADLGRKIPTNAIEKYISTIGFIVETNQNSKEILALYALSTLTILIWLVSFLTLVLAAITYIFLLFSIRGNLKEYCVHKVDKRIDELLKRKSRKRIREARKAELEELERHQRIDSDGQLRALPPLGLKQGPRLPNVQLDYEEEYYAQSHGSLHYGSEYGSEAGSYAGYYTDTGHHHRAPYAAYPIEAHHMPYPPQSQPSLGYPVTNMSDGRQYQYDTYPSIDLTSNGMSSQDRSEDGYQVYSRQGHL